MITSLIYREIGDSPVTLSLIMTSITKNILYLVFVQGLIYLAPLVTLPYLTRVLSVPDFAALGFAQAVIQYFILITDYGFGITATRLIAINSGNKYSVSSVVANTLAVKLILSAAGGLACLLLIAVFADVQQHAVLFLACFIGVLGNALFPTWLFQGLERMRALALITAASRLLPLPLVFVLVKTTDDLVMAAVLQNIPGVVAAAMSFYYARQTKILVRASISVSSIWGMLKEGWPVFLSNISTSFYTTINVILLKLFAGADQVAYFAATDKIRVAAQGFIQPIAAALFPRIAALHEESDKRNESRSLIRRGSYLLLGVQLAGGLVLFYFADVIAFRYLGASFAPAAMYLKALAFLPLVIGFATIISQWRFLAVGESRILSKIYLVAGPLHALYACYLTYRYQSTGLIISLYLTEMLITVAMIIAARKKGIVLW